MKKLFFFIALLLSLNSFANGDEKPAKDTVINKVTYKLFIGSKGGRYTYVTSKKTGKKYRKYFNHS